MVLSMPSPTTVDLPTTLDCAACAGTGEGMHEGATCRTCRGRGYARLCLTACEPWGGECGECGDRTRIVATDEHTGRDYCAACLGIEDAMRDAGEIEDEDAA